MFEGSSPIWLIEGSCSENNMIPWLLSCKNECSLIVVLNQFSVALWDNLLTKRVLVLCKQRCLNKHWSNKMNAFEDFKINFHVMRKLSTFLFLLSLSCFILQSAKSLSKKFFESHILVNLYKDFMWLLDVSQPECGHTCLSKSSVVENLIVYVLDSNHLAHVGL